MRLKLCQWIHTVAPAPRANGARRAPSTSPQMGLLSTGPELTAGVALAAAAWLFVERARSRDRRTTSWTAKAGWDAKRAAFLGSASVDSLMVITDFDATLTSGDSEQCHDMLGASKLLSPQFRAEFAPLLDWTSNVDIDGVEWWDKAHELMVRHATPPRELIPRLVREASMKPRPGALEMLKRLEELGVPVLIVSAGVSDVIEEFLRQHGAMSENVTICSNRLNYEADSTPKSVAPSPPITSFTKEYAYSSARSFFAEHAKRRSILQLGDSLTDVDPAKKVPYDALLSIGFLNSRPDATRHEETFDAVVMGNSGSLHPVTDIIDEIAPTRGILRSFSSMSPSPKPAQRAG